jgi:hypothetical protein
MGLLEQPAFSLEKGDRAVPVILNRLYFNLSPTHLELDSGKNGLSTRSGPGNRFGLQG